MGQRSHNSALADCDIKFPENLSKMQHKAAHPPLFNVTCAPWREKGSLHHTEIYSFLLPSPSQAAPLLESLISNIKYLPALANLWPSARSFAWYLHKPLVLCIAANLPLDSRGSPSWLLSVLPAASPELLCSSAKEGLQEQQYPSAMKMLKFSALAQLQKTSLASSKIKTSLLFKIHLGYLYIASSQLVSKL